MLDDDTTFSREQSDSDAPPTTDGGHSLFHRLPSSLAGDDDNGDKDNSNPPIDLEEVTRIHKEVMGGRGHTYWPEDMQKEPSEEPQPFTLKGGERAIFTKTVDGEGVECSRKEITWQDGSVTGHFNWHKPSSKGSKPITDNYFYEFDPDGLGVGGNYDGFQILRKGQGPWQKVPMTWEGPPSCTYRRARSTTSADTSKNEDGESQLSPLSFIVKPKGPKNGPLFVEYNVR